MISSFLLLTSAGGVIVKDILCHLLHWPVDVYSMVVVMYNFGAVGTLSIFYQKGIPGPIERGYLILTSVIMAWQLLQWPPWSIWAILCLLACWDLFAVLAPCGP